MHLITGITTYNRLDFLKTCVETWDATRNKAHKWVLMIADDGSTDGTKQWLNELSIPGVPVLQILSNRRGVNYGTNRILACSKAADFHYGFKIDDDMVFLKPGWDDLYVGAMQKSPYQHLSFFDKKWGRPLHHEDWLPKGILESSTDSLNVHGCFWTYTQEVLAKVGFFDPFFGFIGYGDTDYTRRCCLAGFNRDGKPFDAVGSNDYLRHGSPGYRAAIDDKLRYKHNDSSMIQQKLERVKNPPSVYVGFDEAAWAGVCA